MATVGNPDNAVEKKKEQNAYETLTASPIKKSESNTDTKVPYRNSKQKTESKKGINKNINSEGSKKKFMLGTSLDATFAIPYGGYTAESGQVANGTDSKLFNSSGIPYGLEASFAFNLIIAIPTEGKIPISDFGGESRNFSVNIGFLSIGYSGNNPYSNSREVNDLTMGDTYNAIKIGFGYGIGFSTSITNTTLSESPSFFEMTKWTLKM